LLVDGINGKALEKELGGKLKDERELGLLARYLKGKGLPSHEQHCEFLRALYGLRSSGSGHRKGANYSKAMRKLDIENTPLPQAAESLFHRSTALLKDLSKYFLGDSA
jgi:hypothetical protein